MKYIIYKKYKKNNKYQNSYSQFCKKTSLFYNVINYKYIIIHKIKKMGIKCFK